MTCGEDCAAFVAKWEAWWREQTQHPVAMLDTCPDYLAECTRKNTRRDVRLARRLYTFWPLEYNNLLNDMHEIDNSAPERQGRPMSKSYTEPKRPIMVGWRLCELHHYDWFGAYAPRHRLVAYANVVILDQLAILNRIIGHTDAPVAVTGLIAYLAETLYPQVAEINYLTLSSSRDSLATFKRRLGFREVNPPPSTSQAVSVAPVASERHT